MLATFFSQCRIQSEIFGDENFAMFHDICVPLRCSTLRPSLFRGRDEETLNSPLTPSQAMHPERASGTF